MAGIKPLIFTDLDGTLLDHDTYDWQAAAPALATARELGVPVIPCTSKTLAECLAIAAELGLQGPIIFENGSGAALPRNQFDRPEGCTVEVTEDYWLCGFGMLYGELCTRLQQVRKQGRYHFRGFSDMTLADVIELTGLPEEAARRAHQRRHSEPLKWLDDAPSFDRFHKDIEAIGLSLTRGGRFVHVLQSVSKGKAMAWLAGLYQVRWGQQPALVALGDSENDIPMLREANTAVIINNPSRQPLAYDPPAHQRLVRTRSPAPEGWGRAVMALFKRNQAHG